MPRRSVGAILGECPDHGLGVPVDDGEQHPRRPVGIGSALLSLLKSPHIQTETVGELLPGQAQPLAERDNPAGSGIVCDPAWQGHLAPNMTENLTQSRFDLDSRLGAFRRHGPNVSFLIAATSGNRARTKS